MKTVIKIFILFGLTLVVANAQEQINATKVPGNVAKIGPKSKAWFSSKYIDIELYPQIANTKINDEAVVQYEKIKKIRVKALYDGENISFLLEWKDSTKNSKKDCCSKVGLDGFALQFPLNFNDISKLPYRSLGNKDRPVVVHLKKASKEDHGANGFWTLDEYYDTFYEIDGRKKVDNGSVFIAEGYRSIRKSKDDADFSVMNMAYKDGFWKGTLSKPLKTKYLDLKGGAFIVSFVVWDGDLNKGSRVEYISSWIGVKLLEKRGGDELLGALQNQVDGDIYNGKKLAIENCAACHNFDDSAIAPAYMAPNLSSIGGNATVQYLIESIIHPSAVIVPNHKLDANLDFPWYRLDEDGNLISTMPSYDWLDERSRNDLVAYFKSLKASK